MATSVPGRTPGARVRRVPLELSTASDRERMVVLAETYADLPLGTVDASIVATAERLGEASVATLDRRHFTVVRPAHVEAFTLLP